MAKEYKNIKLKKAPKSGLLRLPPRVLHTIICEILEDALKADTTVPSLEDGFVTTETIEDYILEKQEQIVDARQIKQYTTDYVIYDLMVKGVNPALKKMNKSATRKKIGKHTCYKGYAGIVEDYRITSTMNRELPVDKGVFEFIKGTMDFNTMAAIRNRINDVADKAWIAFKQANPKYDTNTAKEKEVRAMNKPDAPFICIEGSIYEFTPDYEEKTARERELLLKFADAIIYKKAVKVSYQALHYDKPDELEFHPHYIRKVGNKLMIYGRSRSIAFHKPDEYTLVNLIVHRVQQVTDFDEPIHYYSAKELGLDYNNEVFFNRVTFDAPGFLMGDDTCTEVILKVRKKVETQGNPKMPFQRIISEPIHHSQRILDREDDLFGYISIHVKDYMRMKPILLKWGCDIHVESPEILRQVMEGEVRRMAEMYGIAVTAPESQE